MQHRNLEAARNRHKRDKDSAVQLQSDYIKPSVSVAFVPGSGPLERDCWQYVRAQPLGRFWTNKKVTKPSAPTTVRAAFQHSHLTAGWQQTCQFRG